MHVRSLNAFDFSRYAPISGNAVLKLQVPQYMTSWLCYRLNIGCGDLGQDIVNKACTYSSERCVLVGGGVGSDARMRRIRSFSRIVSCISFRSFCPGIAVYELDFGYRSDNLRSAGRSRDWS